MPTSLASLFRLHSVQKAVWGTLKPRKAPPGTLLEYQAWPRMSTFS